MFYTPKEVADLLKVKETTVWAWIKSGKIEYIKLPGGQYRIPQQTVDKLTTVVV